MERVVSDALVVRSHYMIVDYLWELAGQDRFIGALRHVERFVVCLFLFIDLHGYPLLSAAQQLRLFDFREHVDWVGALIEILQQVCFCRGSQVGCLS